MITENNVIQKSEEQLMSIIDNEAVILGLESGKYVGLNAIGTEIWNRLDQPIKVSKLIQEFAEVYDEKEIIIQNHIIEFLTMLYKKSLIRLHDETQSEKS